MTKQEFLERLAKQLGRTPTAHRCNLCLKMIPVERLVYTDEFALICKPCSKI